MRQSSPASLLFTERSIMVDLRFSGYFHILSTVFSFYSTSLILSTASYPVLQFRMKPSHLPHSLWLLALQPTVAFAYWRMACSVSQTSRIDPIVDPGAVSGHVHKFAGGNSAWSASDPETNADELRCEPKFGFQFPTIFDMLNLRSTKRQIRILDATTILCPREWQI